MSPILTTLVTAAGLVLAGQALANGPCGGTVTFGEGDTRIVTSVPNRPAGGSCFNDRIVDTGAEGANYGNHGEFVREVGKLAGGWLRERRIGARQFSELITAAARSDVGRTLKLRIIAFNDFHGYIDGSNLSLRSDPDNLFLLNAQGQRTGVPAGGVDYMAGLVEQLRSGAPNSVVVSAGDLIGASPLNSALFHDEPAIETMNRLGLEFNAVGNHEFDEGREELLRMKHGGCHPTDPNSCRGDSVGTPYPFEGARFDFLAANVVDTASAKTLFPAYGVKDFKGNRVAFIGMTLKATPTIVTPAGVAGLEFRGEAETVNDLVGRLKRRGIDAVVVLLHEGGVAPGSIDSCSGVSGPIVGIVGQLDDAVDLVISGHTHQAYNCRLPNRAGRAIPVTSAGSFGRLLTRIDVAIDTTTRDFKQVSAANVLVDRNNFLGSDEPIRPVPEIARIVANYNALATPIANRVIGRIAADITTSRNGAGESALGDVIADAQLAATAPVDKGGAVVAFMNPGGIRTNLTFASSAAGEGDGSVTYGEAFTVQPFGNSLVVKTLTGQQIYDLLRQQWVQGQFPDGGRTLQVSRGFTYRHTFVPNVSPMIDPAAEPGKTYVCAGTVTINGVPLDPAASYRVAMNSFLATGGDGYSVFNLGTDQLGGDVDLDAMEAYFRANPEGVAPGPQNRIQQVADCG